MNIISLGAGVQSSTLALMAKHGEIPYKVDCAIFADTQAEPRSVYTWLDWLETVLPYPVFRVTAGSLTEESLRSKKNEKGETYRRRFIPAFVAGEDGVAGPLGRSCTRDFKLAPLRNEKQRLANVPRGCKDVMVTTLIGISLDEAHRMKPSSEAWSVNVYPLIEAKMTRSDCLNWMEKNGYPSPPRSACVYCPYHSDREWLRLREEEPDAFAAAVKFERDLQATQKEDERTSKLKSPAYLHRSLVPLDQVKFKHERQVNLFGNECEGMCGL